MQVMSENSPQPFNLVIFGASGDLTHRKLIPAIYSLFRQGLLPVDFSVIGFARRDNDDEGFRRQMRRQLANAATEPFDEPGWEAFAQRLYYHQGNFDDADSYMSLRRRLERMAGQGQEETEPEHCLLELERSLLFYLATQPIYFGSIVNHLKKAGLSHSHRQGGWTRVIVEKPFGHDLSSARQMNREIGQVFREGQIYRIDHYLGKETVQNLLVLRFANSIFEPLWNHNYIDHVQITVSETVGVEGRGAFYDKAGAVRDIVQNHMMHLLSLVAMEPPFSLDADVIRDEKVQVLKSLRPIPPGCVNEMVVRGQYTAGKVKGRQLAGYQDEDRVVENSRTETFVAMKVLIDNWRWAGVPFYLRTGKAMPARITEIGIHFKSVPKVLFNAVTATARQSAKPDDAAKQPMKPNCLSIRIQPNEGISMQFQVKVPGASMKIEPFNMQFSYAGSFDKKPPEAYERLLLDAVLGDGTLFTRSDEVEASWALLEPIMESCACEKAGKLPTYAAGTWGPVEADELIQKDGRMWYLTRRQIQKPRKEKDRK